MKNVNANLLCQVMQELIEIHRDDKEALRWQYTCIQILLSRTSTITRAEKAKIEKRLHMFQELFEGSPLIQEIRKVSHDQGLEEGLQCAIVNVIKNKYPDLVEFAQQKTSHFSNPEKLDWLISQVMSAPDANTIRGILEAEAGLEGK